MWGYGEEASFTASRSKKRAPGIRRERYSECPFRGLLGRYHSAERGMIRLPGFLRAVDSSLGETMKEENERVDIARERRGTLRRNIEPGKSVEIEESCRELSYVTRFTCLAGY
jgi:hypothetical protein